MLMDMRAEPTRTLVSETKMHRSLTINPFLDFGFLVQATRPRSSRDGSRSFVVARLLPKEIKIGI
jgi:hypothetical protein